MPTEYVTDLVDIPGLIGYVREQQFEGLTLDTILPPLEVPDIEYELTNISNTAIQVARYRTWDTAPPLGKRPGFAQLAGELPPLGLSLRMGERFMLQLEAMRAGLRQAVPPNGGVGGQQFFPYPRLPGAGRPNESDPERVIFDDALQCVRAVQSRLEVARGDLLTDGVVTINEGGVNLTANFNVPGTHIVTAATPWSNLAASTPLTDIGAWLTVYRAGNQGRNPDFFLTSSEVVANLTQNAQIRNLAPVMGVVPGIITEQTIAQVFATQGYPPILTYDTELPTATSDTFTRVINARKFIAVRSGLGNTLYGTTADAMQLAGEGVIDMADAPGVIAYVERQQRPAAIYTTGSGIGLPILRDPNALFVATV
jgi:hypothetical protein